MPVYKFDALKKEYVTPKHSTAFGSLVTGEQIEVGMLRFKAGEGANEHAHPHEQVLVVLSGRVRMTIGGESHELGPREVAHMPPNVPHSPVVCCPRTWNRPGAAAPMRVATS